ncbi:MAG: CRISPR-associated helicase Cas3' [Rubripirellula sp.]
MVKRSNAVPIAHRRDVDGASQLVEAHLQNVGSLSRDFAGKLGLHPFGELCGLLHDVGKVSKQFQDYLKSAVGMLDPDFDEGYVDAAGLKGKIDHSTSGSQWIWRQLREADVVTAQAIAICIASHHSGLIDCVGGGEGNFGQAVFAKRMGKRDFQSNFTEVEAKMPHSIAERCKEILASESPTFFETCGNISQRYLGNEVSFCVQSGLLVRFLFSCLIDADRIDTANFEFPHLENMRSTQGEDCWKDCVARMEHFISDLNAKYEIDHVRASISSRCKEQAQEPKGAFTLSVPTGGGKTYSSLRFALHHAEKHSLDRILFIIPFNSIIDQNAKAVRKVLSDRKGETVLEVHSNLTPHRQSYHDKVVAANWDAPIVFTTMVQFLESLFGGGTRGARRMHQLTKSVIIFDEIQSLPHKCVHLFNQAVNFLVEHGESSVVLCTATQPLLHTVNESKGRLRLSTSSEITAGTEQLYSMLRRTHVHDMLKPDGWSSSEIAQLAIDQTVASGSCLAVVNTKRMATAIYTEIELRNRDSQTEVFHLSTNMCPAHRKVVLFQIKRRLSSALPVICVSTQLIEAGVDVDFGSAIRSLAGLDSIAQTAGRCNRNGADEFGNVFVVNPSDENLHGLPEIQTAIECTKRVFADFNKAPGKYGDDLIGPRAMNWFYENYFHARAGEMDYPVPASQIGHDDTILNLLGQNSLAYEHSKTLDQESPNICFRQAFMTAARAFEVIDAPTEGIVVPFGRRGRDIIGRLSSAELEQQPYRILREAQQFSVNVFPNVFSALQRVHAIHRVSDEFNIFHLDERFYSQNFGLSTDVVSEMEVLNV